MPFFTGLFSGVEIAQADIVSESTDEINTHYAYSYDKGLFRKEGIRNDYIAQFQQLLFMVMERQQIMC